VFINIRLKYSQARYCPKYQSLAMFLELYIRSTINTCLVERHYCYLWHLRLCMMCCRKRTCRSDLHSVAEYKHVCRRCGWLCTGQHSSRFDIPPYTDVCVIASYESVTIRGINCTRSLAVAKRPCDCCVAQFWPIFCGNYRFIFNHCDAIDFAKLSNSEK